MPVLTPAAPDAAPEAGTPRDPSFVIPAAAPGGPVATPRAGLAAEGGMPVGALLLDPPGADARPAAFLLSDAAARPGR